MVIRSDGYKGNTIFLTECFELLVIIFIAAAYNLGRPVAPEVHSYECEYMAAHELAGDVSCFRPRRELVRLM